MVGRRVDGRGRRTPTHHHEHEPALTYPRDLGKFDEQLWGNSMSAVISEASMLELTDRGSALPELNAA